MDSKLTVEELILRMKETDEWESLMPDFDETALMNHFSK